MAYSSSSATRALLEGYVAGRVPAERLVPAIAAEYYRSADRRQREALRPVIEVIERAAPGVVKLARTEGGAGFDIALAERPFSDAHQAELRQAVDVALAAWGAGPGAGAAPAAGATPAAPGFWSRLVGRVRRLFSASS
jgi:hypothetical protein